MVATISISPHHHHTLRTYIVLNNKANRPRLASFTDLLEYGSIDPTMKKTSPKNEDFPEECLAFESYAAVASRFHSTSPTRDIRWSDLNRPRLHLATALFTSTRQSQKLRKRQIRRARASKGNPNDHLQVSALELSFEFLDLTDLINTTMVCTEFRDTVYNAPSLLLGWYARKWRMLLTEQQQETMANAYYAIGYPQLLDMCRARRSDAIYELSTRSQVTLRPDSTYEVINNSLLRSFKRGSIDSIRGIKPLPILPSAQVFHKNLSYYEVSMKGCGSVGIVSISDASSRDAYGFCSEEHVGWKAISFGYHGNDGDFVYNDGSAPYGGEWKPYGPSWGGINTHEDKSAEMFTIGCGLNMDTNELFFTRNGIFLGVVPFTIPCSKYAAAISLHEFGDQCIVNAGSAPFTFDIEGFCASS